MSKKYEKLKSLLKELFQLDQPDLDFGLYRIMHAKSAEITQFLDKDLLPQVKAEFARHESGETAELKKQLDKRIKMREELGDDPDQDDQVQRLRAEIAGSGSSPDQLESEVYDHLFGFFRRYYSDGDFLSKRVYKPGVYAIPYEGEEVKLHWANADQYYIKTSEYLRDYAFRLRPDDDENPMRVHFRLADVKEGEHGNVKATEGKDRVFILAPSYDPNEQAGDENDDSDTEEENTKHNFIEEDPGEAGEELVLRFEYRQATLNDWSDSDREGKKKPPKQKDLLEIAESRVTAFFSEGGILETENWFAQLSASHTKTNGEKADYSRLRAHLNRYVARNTFDYFIHKDLGGFLSRELDFFIKNEVMHLDDIENETVPRVEQYLSKIKVIRRVAGKIIAFLAQLEDFQKMLWLKTKFVLETNYCLTLDKVPEQFYGAICANADQRNEWIRLFSINGIEGDLATAGYEVPLTEKFLRENPTLPVDTAYFDDQFKYALLDKLGDLSTELGGVLVHSENLHALRLIERHYANLVGCIYVDPPYNTGKDGFVYKDNYEHSSWMTFIRERLQRCRSLLNDRGAIFCSIDDNEAKNLEEILNQVFGGRQLLAPLFVQVRYANKTLSEDNDFQRTIERIFFYAKDRTVFKPVKDKVPYPVEKFCWQVTELKQGEKFRAGGRDCYLFKPGEYRLEKIKPSTTGLKETWATGSLLRQKGSSGEFFGTNLAPRKATDGLSCLYKVDGIGEDGIGHRYFTGPQRESATKGKFFSGIPLQTLAKIEAGDASKEVPIHNFFDFASDFGNCRLEGRVDILGGKKPEKLIARLINFASPADADSVVLDPFAGSGTTPSVSHKLGKRYVAIEQSDYFDTKMLQRQKRTLFGDTGGLPERKGGVFKYIRLESYEDALNNLEVKQSDQQASLLESNDDMREQYMLRYMLDVETAGSPSLLNVASFIAPTAYKLKVKRPGSDETRETNVDLIETFNWLIGLTVNHLAAPQCFEAKFERDSEKRMTLKGRLKSKDDAPHWFRTVTGTTPDGRKTLVIWRKRPGGEDPTGVEQDNLVLDAWFTKQGYSSKDSEFDLIYVNGTNNLENLRTATDTWKVRLIEEDFHRLMFEDTK